MLFENKNKLYNVYCFHDTFSGNYFGKVEAAAFVVDFSFSSF